MSAGGGAVAAWMKAIEMTAAARMGACGYADEAALSGLERAFERELENAKLAQAQREADAVIARYESATSSTRSRS